MVGVLFVANECLTAVCTSNRLEMVTDVGMKLWFVVKLGRAKSALELKRLRSRIWFCLSVLEKDLFEPIINNNDKQ